MAAAVGSRPGAAAVRPALECAGDAEHEERQRLHATGDGPGIRRHNFLCSGCRADSVGVACLPAVVAAQSTAQERLVPVLVRKHDEKISDTCTALPSILMRCGGNGRRRAVPLQEFVQWLQLNAAGLRDALSLECAYGRPDAMRPKSEMLYDAHQCSR